SEIGPGPPFLATGYDYAITSVSQSSNEGCTSRSIANFTVDSINIEFEVYVSIRHMNQTEILQQVVSKALVRKSGSEVDLVKGFLVRRSFDNKGFWVFEDSRLAATLEELHATTIVAYDSVIQKKAYNALILCSGDRVLQEFTKETTAAGIWKKVRGDLAAIDTTLSDEDQALLLLTSLPSFYDNFMDTLLYGRDTLKLEDVLATINSMELQKMTEAKGDGGEGLYVRWRSGPRDMEYNHKKSQGFVRNKDKVSGSRADGYDSVDVMMVMSIEQLLDWIMDLGGSYHMTYIIDYLFNFEENDSGNILLGDGRECRVRGTLTRKALKGRKQLGEYQTG
ncbi:hypothetical protein Tco_1259582, partial [Tanacetum coccineum]